jgi:hypothetical protein
MGVAILLSNFDSTVCLEVSKAAVDEDRATGNSRQKRVLRSARAMEENSIGGTGEEPRS